MTQIQNFPLFSQRDSRWAGDKLGTSTSLIGGYGCLVTSFAMVCKYYGKDTDPTRLNTAFVNAKAFASGNLYIWNSIGKVYSDIAETKNVQTPSAVTTDQFNSIKAEIDAGRPVIIEVDFNPNTTMVDPHFIVLIGYADTGYIVADPWYGDIANLDRYGKPEVTLQRFIFTSGPITIPAPAQTDQEKIVSTIVTSAWNSLGDTDPNKSNFESYARAITADYLSFAENQGKAVQLDGLVQQWTKEWNLTKPDGSQATLADLQAEMSKYLPLEDQFKLLVDKVETVLGHTYQMDDARLQALDALNKDITDTRDALKVAQDKLASDTAISSFFLFNYLIKIYKKGV